MEEAKVVEIVKANKKAIIKKVLIIGAAIAGGAILGAIVAKKTSNEDAAIESGVEEPKFEVFGEETKSEVI